MSLIQTITNTCFVKPHPAGLPFIGAGLIAAIILMMIYKPLGITALLLTVFIYYFFRDPVRAVPQDENLVLSPADGRVIAISSNNSLPDDLIEEDDSETYTKISIFLSVLDAHVNRVPFGGEVIKTFYYEGKFLNAELDKASEENERAHALVKAEKGKLIAFSQIAGLVARRIITDLKEGDEIKAGHRFGLIRFGSRMDVYLPDNMPVMVCEGQTAIAGETILADFGTKRKKSLTAQKI
ncbi:MAG: phosphatidylserine decarboxylase [Gammaproteobacteria bacterium]|nr:phosphatidylserine decarboxylase [Gammaproteobacteria bacterium]